ncbi:hypothetical protein V5799_023034 [Amblyomma americanum]|uniref:Uncharacterized protein n=1 Tax=Amblyomma americanum TaxID=6943 RepID=A0AAQ4FKY8_AMBAM
MRRQATKKQEPATRHGSTEELLTSETETPPTKPKPSTFTTKKPTSASTQTLTTEKELSSVAELSAATTTTKVVSATKPPASTVKKTPEVIKPSATTTRKVSSVSKHPVTSTQKTERVTQQPGKINKTLSPKELHPELGPRPLVCVYGNGSLASSPFPEDGLCDAALFDSLYKYPGYALSTVHDQNLAHLRRFLRHAEEYELTRFGMGVTAGAAEIAKAEFSSNTAEKHYLPYLWSNNVYDLGVLDFVPDENTNEEQAQRIFDFLKNYTLLYMSEHQETFEDARTAVSMSLAGRWYRSKSGGKNKAAYMVGAKCEPYESKEYLYELQHFTYTKENPAFGPKNTFLDERRWVMVSYSPDKNLALLFDSPATIYMKRCDMRELTPAEHHKRHQINTVAPREASAPPTPRSTPTNVSVSMTTRMRTKSPTRSTRRRPKRSTAIKTSERTRSTWRRPTRSTTTKPAGETHSDMPKSSTEMTEMKTATLGSSMLTEKKSSGTKANMTMKSAETGTTEMMTTPSSSTAP